MQVGMAFLSEVLAGAMFPGKPLAVLTCMVYGRQILEQNLNLISDYKFGFYMKIPETEMFIGQVYGTLLGPFINYGMMRKLHPVVLLAASTLCFMCSSMVMCATGTHDMQPSSLHAHEGYILTFFQAGSSTTKDQNSPAKSLHQHGTPSKPKTSTPNPFSGVFSVPKSSLVQVLSTHGSTTHS